VQTERRVEKNKEALGVDNLIIGSLKPYLRQNWLSIKEQLLKGDYEPQPVLRVENDKPNRGKRLLKLLANKSFWVLCQDKLS